MADCELCGRSVSSPVRAKIEGVVIDELCSNCASLGESLGDKKDPAVFAPRARRMKLPEEDIVADYGQRVKSARERKQWTMEQLARSVMETEAVVKRVEEGKLKPSPDVARKLERALGIVLIERIESVDYDSDDGQKNTGSMTLGDLLKDARNRTDSSHPGIKDSRDAKRRS